MRRLDTTLLWLGVALAIGLAMPARADNDEQAKQRFLDGKQAYLEGRYAEAAVAFKAAAALRPSPILEFNLGRCYEKLGRDADALAAYQRYLAAAKDAPNRADVEARVAELQTKLKRSQDPYELLDSRGAASRPAAAPPPPARAQPRPLRAEEGRHEAELPESWAQAGQGAPSDQQSAPGYQQPAARAPAGPTQPQRPAPLPRRDEGPIYKQWWFWVACAGGAVIAGFIIATAASSSGEAHHGSESHSLGIRF